MDFSVVDSFVKSFQESGMANEDDAKLQVFKPTCCPDAVEVVPGVVMRKPDNMDYAPTIEVAEPKITAIKQLAKSGAISILNITLEPGSGKTIHLPFRFQQSRVLVVLPTLFDAWCAKLSCAKQSSLISFNYITDKFESVTYTDSYYASFLLSTGKMTRFDMVFVDECDSNDGVTMFMASAAVPGVSFVRMSATPKGVRTMPRKSFPIMDEKVAPKLSDVVAVGEFVKNRPEDRKMVMTPSSQSAELVASQIPGAVLLTSKSSPADVPLTLGNQSGPITIVTDSVCNKGINLNLDFLLDFALIETPTGTRSITIPEQQQRRGRVGRMRAGVYCCSFVAKDMTYHDDYSIFRSNIWCLVNGLQTFPCDIPVPSKSRALKLLKMITEPAAVPFESPILSSSSSADNYDDALDASGIDLNAGHRSKYSDMVQVDDQPDVVGGDPFSDVPSWVTYYMEATNHPNCYVGDMVYDHRSLGKHLLISPELALKPAKNLIQSATTDKVEHHRTYKSADGRPETYRRFSSSTRSSETYNELISRKVASNSDLVISTTTPLKLKRGVRSVGGALGTSYKALSVTGSYIVESGMLIAESPRVHSTLKPLPTSIASVLSRHPSSASCGKATYYSSWVVAKPVVDVDVQLEVATFSAGDAWAIPFVSEVPDIDLHTQYHSAWQKVLSERVRHKQVLPMVTPVVGWPRRSTKGSTDPLLDALDRCDDPCYSVSEQQLVYRAWNVVAAKSASVAPCSAHVYNDAATLLSYMASADKLSRF